MSRRYEQKMLADGIIQKISVGRRMLYLWSVGYPVDGAGMDLCLW